MRRKLICLMLCLLAVFSLCFAGCSGEEEDDSALQEETSAREAVSLNMWVICEKPVNEETEALVEKAFNELTQAKYTTKVDFIFLTEDEYYTTLDAALNTAAEIKATSGADTMLPVLGEETTEVVETTAETIVNELGQRLLKYPDIEEGQIDIVFLSGKELHDRYVTEGKIQTIETNLNSTSKVLKDYIYPDFLNQVKQNNNTYAIPVNHEIGDYTFLLINKAMAEKYYIDLGNVNTFAACNDLIVEIGENETIAPVLEYVAPVNVQYWLDYNNTEPVGELKFSVGDVAFDAFGAEKKAPVAPVDVNGTIMVPFEFFAKAMGGSYSWDEETATATVKYGAREILVTVGSATATVLDTPVAMGAAAFVDAETGVVMVPVDFAATSLCATATVDGNDVTVAFNEYDGMSVLVSSYNAKATLQNRTPMVAAFGNEAFAKHMVLMKKCEENGWFAEDPANTSEFGVAIVKGDYEDIAQYEDKYEVKVLSYPELTEESVYEALFAVSSYTANLDRAMEIITLINTDEDAKNTLLYGVEGVHYEFDDDENFVIISDDYSMNNIHTGNMFLAYTTADVSEDIWSNAMSSNLDSRVSPYYGLASVWGNIDPSFFTTLRALSNDYFDRMQDCETSEELADFFANAKKELGTNMVFAAALSTADDSTSPYAIYTRWGTSNKYWTVE